MTIVEMFGQSAVLSLLGMSVVFLFLATLILVVALVAKVVKAMGWDSDIKAKSTTPAAALNTGVVAAIGAAVHEYHKSTSGETQNG